MNNNNIVTTTQLSLVGCGVVLGVYLTWSYLVPNGGCLRADKQKLDSIVESRKRCCDDDEHEGKEEQQETPSTTTNTSALGTLDLRRKSILLFGGPIDATGHVVIFGDSKFDLNETVFHNVNPKLRLLLKNELGITFLWTEYAQERIQQEFQQYLKPKLSAASLSLDGTNNRQILEFMQHDCNFAMEHADGSFMDHLQFCYNYAQLYFPQQSPRVLLLHSIMGVATNYFPVTRQQIPQLQSMVSKDEFQHIEMFPSVLRLLSHGPLIEELLYRRTKAELLTKWKKITFYRVIDNQKLEIQRHDNDEHNMQAFWIQVNYQLIHLLDFVPISSLKYNLESPFLQNLILFYRLLQKVDQLYCTFDFELLQQSIQLPDKQGQQLGQKMSFINTLVKLVFPTSMKLKVARKQIKQYSDKIGHDLTYELQFEE